VFIMLDSLRRDHLGCYGNTTVRTPNLDRFAEENLVFEDARIGSYPTGPNRYDLFTGRFGFPWRGWDPVPSDAVTAPDMLRKNGFATSLIVDTPNIGRDRSYWKGFETWQFVPGQEGSHVTINRNVAAPKLCDLSKMRYSEQFSEDHIRKIAQRRLERDEPLAQTVLLGLDWLDLNLDNLPFLLWLDTFQVHEPWYPPLPYRAMYDPGYTGEVVIAPKYGRHSLLSEEEAKHTRALYAGDVTFTDRWVGIFLDKLRDIGLYDRSVVIVTSDHGHYHGEHGNTWGKPQGSLYSEVNRIPLIVHHPDIKGGRRVDGLVQPADMSARILEAAGIALPETFHGKPFWNLLKGEANRDVAVMGRLDGPLSITDGNWLHVRWSRSAEDIEKIQAGRLGWTGVGADELYHSGVDGGESENDITGNPQRAEDLRHKAKIFLEEIAAPAEFIRRFF
jgi:arylsulfatase A-like enzyme